MKKGDDDLPLFARHGDPVTSHKAMAEYNREKMRDALTFVVYLFSKYGPMADYQLADRFEREWTEPCCDHLYRQARSVARDKGRVVDTGSKVRNPLTNRMQIVWAISNNEPIKIEKCPTCGHVLRRNEKS